MRLLKLVAIAFIITGIGGCKKPQLSTMDAPNDDAAIIIAESIATNNYGMSYITQDISNSAITLSNNSNTACGLSVTDSVFRKSASGLATSYDYKLKYTNKLDCNSSNLPDHISGNLTYKGSFKGPKLSSDNSGNRSYRITGLSSSDANHVFNGVFKCYNHYKLLSDTTNKGIANIYLGIENLLVSKVNHNIIGGKAMVMITGSSSKKANFTYNGKMTFTPTHVMLTLNGDEYSIDIATGAIVKI